VAELTNLETKLGEVIGLAMAAQVSIDRVSKLAKDEQELTGQLQTMRQEAKDAEQKGTELASTFEGKKSKILTEARSVKKKGGEMLQTYLDKESDLLDGLEFMTMAEAGEVGHWQVLEQMNKKAKHPGIRQLTKEQLAIQKRHLREVMLAATTVAAQEDPNEEG
jgi:rubrerythrin